MDFEKELAAFLDRQPPLPSPVLNESIRYSLLNPGKRIRPRLSRAVGRWVDLPEAVALRPAIAVELAHVFTLIHDDLPCMDNDDFRRGKPSNHKAFGESIALLAGDGLMALAVDALLELNSPAQAWNPKAILECISVFTKALGVHGVMGGQAMEALVESNPSLELLRTMHHRKTGDLFWASIMMPARLAGVHGDASKALEEFSRAIGAAFQIADDLEDFKNDGEQSPKNIAFYTSTHWKPSDVARETASKLKEAVQALELFWSPLAAAADRPPLHSDESETLISISKEVLSKLLPWTAE